jgi:hypothetical protein
MLLRSLKSLIRTEIHRVSAYVVLPDYGFKCALKGGTKLLLLLLLLLLSVCGSCFRITITSSSGRCIYVVFSWEELKILSHLNVKIPTVRMFLILEYCVHSVVMCMIHLQYNVTNLTPVVH